MTHPDHEANLTDARAVLERLEGGGDVDPADMRVLAQSLLNVAELAMPDTYFATDTRCRLARAVLTALARQQKGNLT